MPSRDAQETAPEGAVERAKKLAALDAALDRGLTDIETGHTHPADEVFAELRARYQGES